MMVKSMAHRHNIPEQIEIRGARVHNLKNVNVDIPLHQIVGIAGVSGSGKSSLALGVLYAEGSRRYLESLSTYTRRRMTQAAKAQVSERRRTAKVKKLATVYANEAEHGLSHGPLNMILAEQKPDFREAVHEEAERILAKREAKARKDEARAAQISIFDLGNQQ